MIYSAFNGIVLRPLPFHEPHSLVFVEEKWLPRFSEFETTPAHFRAWEEQTRTLGGLAAFATSSYGNDGGESPSNTLMAKPAKKSRSLPSSESAEL